MLKRPKNTDTMDDVLEMQREYTERKNKNLQPAAQAISKNTNQSAHKTSIFARQKNIAKKKNQKDTDKADVISDVIERKYDAENLVERLEEMDIDSGFPEVISIEYKDDNLKGNGSLFASLMNAKAVLRSDNGNSDIEKIEEIKSSVDTENLALLQSMTSDQILKEKEELVNAMDPNLMKFLIEKSKKNQKVKHENISGISSDNKTYTEDPSMKELLEEVTTFNYLNMNILEPEKLEWLKSFDEIYHSVPKDKKYEARFDFKGFLLPYTFDNEDSKKDNRELYCHEDECHRPGYTIQELFRLARAEVLQQRVTAISAICGVINMYMQGFYDEIIELPISKIFFFLRFGLDENIPAIIDACSRGLSYLFYNEADEVLLDIIFETRFGFIQPIINSISRREPRSLEETFENLNLNEHVFESNINDDDILSSDDRDRESMTDFHLAEINIVDCLERANIIERISYIMVVMTPNQSTVISCLKMLIRLTRNSSSFAEKLLRKRNLIDFLLSENVLTTEKSRESEKIVKLFRIVGSYKSNNFSTLMKFSLFDKIRSFISSQSDMNAQYIKLQIECFRLLRLHFHSCQDEIMFNSIIFPLRYLLEWHIHHLDFHQKNHFICRVHASALLNVIKTSNVRVTYSLFGETLKMCCKKWFQCASSQNLVDISQSILLSSCLDVAGEYLQFTPEFFYDFINGYMIKFLKSSSYKNITDSLHMSSLVLNDFMDRRFDCKPLINLGSIVRKRENRRQAPRLIYSQDYAGYLINSIVMFIGCLKNEWNEMNMKLFERMEIYLFGNGVEKFMQKFSILSKTPLISSNWFAQIEIQLIYNLLSYFRNQPWVFRVAFHLIQNITVDKYMLIIHIFDNFIFHEDYSNGILTKTELERMKYIYNGLLMTKIKQENQVYSSVNDKWDEFLLNSIWPLELLLIFHIQNNNCTQIVETDLTDEEIIKTSLKLKSFLSLKQIYIGSHDEQLMFLMLIYMGKNLSFLDEDIKSMIRKELEALKGKIFKFNIKLNKEKDFESFYKLFLETFQAQSYADTLFSSFVMVPLIQTYDIKWRKIVWSEYAMVLKFITCDESDLLYSMDEYLYPIETDESLLMSYRSSLKYLKKDSIPWKIAVHHLNHFQSLQ